MLTIGFPAMAFATNCFVLATGAGEDCVVVDPGIGVVDRLGEIFREYRLRPRAVLLTHGHVDHTYSVTPVCGGELAAYIHRSDSSRLHDPLTTVDRGLVGMIEQQFGERAVWQDPSTVVEITDREILTIAGLDFEVAHAPGHTAGSVIFTVGQVPQALGDNHGLDATALTGDVLFAGSIGRTDLPGGDPAAMTRSLREVVLPMPDATLVLPGHGPASTIARERAVNPYLQGLS